ncbi:MAG: MerR family transcriptional regulator [Cloacibacillus sp.]
MRDYYKISEISKLYGIGADSLRYYERLGILRPHRDDNGYRLYRLKEMYKLNIIRDLRRLDFSMSQIKEYLADQNVDNTLELLHSERRMLEERILELKNRKGLINERIAVLNNAREIKTNIFTKKTLRERFCVQLCEHITRDEEMDFAVKRLHRKHEEKIRDLGNQVIGAFLSIDRVRQGIANVYDAVFFILEQKTTDYDFILPAGEYLSYFYSGGYGQNVERMEEMLSYAARNKLRLLGEPFEMYEIDNRDTVREEEFLTEIQVRIAEDDTKRE